MGVQAGWFTLNGAPTFLLGLSYYGALGASEATWRRDLANERSVRDARFVRFTELKELRGLVMRLDPPRLVTASDGGAAGWCFHNGDRRDTPDHRPRRSFDLRERPLFEQLDEQERQYKLSAPAGYTAAVENLSRLELVRE